MIRSLSSKCPLISSKESPRRHKSSYNSYCQRTLTSGEFPSAFKQSLIRPAVLKKADLDKTCSQYTFPSKSHWEGCRSSNTFTLGEKSFGAFYAIRLPKTSLHRDGPVVSNERCFKDYWSSARCCFDNAWSVSRIWHPRPYYTCAG